MYLHAPRTKSTQQAPRIKPCRTGTKDEVILTHTEDEAMPTHTEDEPHRPYLPPYVCTGNVKFRISKTPLWCQKSFFLIQGTLQMTGHSQRRRHSSVKGPLRMSWEDACKGKRSILRSPRNL